MHQMLTWGFGKAQSRRMPDGGGVTDWNNGIMELGGNGGKSFGKAVSAVSCFIFAAI